MTKIEVYLFTLAIGVLVHGMYLILQLSTINWALNVANLMH